jgi:hypothetical protein
MGEGCQEVNKQQFPDEKNWLKFAKTFLKKYYCIAGSDKKHTCGLEKILHKRFCELQ